MSQPRPRPPVTDPAGTAGYLAREARRQIDLARDPATTSDDRELYLLDAQACALTSLAFTQLNPPARKWRDRAPRQVDITAPTAEAAS